MKSTFSNKILMVLSALTVLGLFAGSMNAPAQEGEPTPGPVAEVAAADADFSRDTGDAYSIFVIDNLWILIAAFLVFTMHLGFSTLESGLTRQKNAVNVLFKNVFIICVGILTYAICGFNLMYPGFEEGQGFLKFAGFGIPGMGSLEDAGLITPSGYGLDMTTWSDFLFQAMFAATGATIVSGAVAERVKLPSFMIFATLLVAIAYPISGSWKWGAGWLDQKGFYDFAGSSVVHAFGGFAALACVLLLGARKGKYGKDGQVKPILGHSMPLATMGVFFLWLGWFGFNGGSVLNADPVLVSYVCVTTAIAAAAGGFASMIISWTCLKKPDLSMALNGILAGLVGITAGADSVGILPAAIIGLIAGTIVVFAIIGFDKLKIDDPVGAISVHGVCGIWGTLAVGIPFFNGGNADLSFGTQLLGTAVISLWAFAFSFIVFGALKLVMGVRVSEQEEIEGLDMGEHGVPAYADFTSR
jgi:Amt family ammonium transporter